MLAGQSRKELASAILMRSMFSCSTAEPILRVVSVTRKPMLIGTILVAFLRWSFVVATLHDSGFEMVDILMLRTREQLTVLSGVLQWC